MGRKQRWLGVMAVLALLAAGCSGVLHESHFSDGQTVRVVVKSPEGWSSFDKNATKPDETCIMLKHESSF